MSDASADRWGLVDLLNAYGGALDDRDWDALAACFAADGSADYGPELGVHHGGAAVAALCRGVLASLDATQHVITNHRFDLRGDAAEVRCHVVAQHTRAGASGGENYTLGGSYRLAAVRDGDAWRIRRLVLHVRWREGNPAVLEPA